MKRLIAIALIACAAPAAGSAAPLTAVVRYGDLDLSRSDDAAMMMRRIDRAALSACGASKVSVRELQRAVREGPCFQETLARTVSALNAPAVSAIYREQMPQMAAR
ncbi:UrcA family protein [Phenylobacterium sp. J426]|uniref:UrcA family protein n=1 Tax=Phenylobacterium sp. J426 TaxID=2898439 RepID=UPI002151512F|nr:UrcA family protein [Phenylobacterium sp. J426]MCR5876309.1 UrcA family protein [Phenylobacterium sp. J426]